MAWMGSVTPGAFFFIAFYNVHLYRIMYFVSVILIALRRSSATGGNQLAAFNLKSPKFVREFGECAKHSLGIRCILYNFNEYLRILDCFPRD